MNAGVRQLESIDPSKQNMQRERILAVLEAALPVVPPSDAPEHAFLLLLHYAAQDPARSDPRLVALVDTLRTSPGLESFNGYMQVVGSAARRVEYHDLAGWLLRRAQQVASDQAVADLEHYAAVTELPFELTLALGGLNLTATCQLGPDLSLLPWEGLRPSAQKQRIYEQQLMTFHWPTAALVHTILLPKLHVGQDDLDAARPAVPRGGLDDALLCLGLIGPVAPYALASWLAPPDWAPVLTGGYAMPHLEGVPRRRDWPPDTCKKVQHLVQTFAKLPDTVKARLRVPMQRLNIAMRRASPVDAAIDLGIALEALFLSDLADDRGELTFRLRLRAARYIEADSEKRCSVFKLVGHLYAARSAAVHSGRLPAALGDAQLGELLEAGYTLTATTIRRFLTEGEPDWQVLMFS